VITIQFLVAFCLTLLYFYTSLQETVEEIELKVIAALLWWEIFFIFSVTYCASLRSLWIVDLTGPLVCTICGGTTIVASIYYIPETTEMGAFWLGNNCGVVYLMLLMFCSTDYGRNLCVRVTFFVVARVPVL